MVPRPFWFAFALIAFAPGQQRSNPPVLLFAGTGISPGDAAAVEAVLKNSHVTYAKVTSLQLNSMTVPQLMAYRLLIIPGGNFLDIGNSLSPSAVRNIHDAVQDGLNYLGLCAGAFLAGRASYTSLDLARVQFPFYSAERRGIRKASVAITTPGSPTLEHYWEDGPELSGWGSVVGKYPDGTPAIVQGS